MSDVSDRLTKKDICKMPSRGPGEIDSRLARVLDISKELEERKKLYAELDEILLGLAAEGFTSAEFDGLVLTLRDNFAKGNTGWTSAAVRRFDMEVVTKELAEKRARRAAKGGAS